jgi:hypothetical protein
MKRDMEHQRGPTWEVAFDRAFERGLTTQLKGLGIFGMLQKGIISLKGVLVIHSTSGSLASEREGAAAPVPSGSGITKGCKPLLAAASLGLLSVFTP